MIATVTEDSHFIFDLDHQDGLPLHVDSFQMAQQGAKGARIGCLTGDCGACSVELDGRIAKSCLVLAASVDGSEIVTIEGSRDAIAVAMREAFTAHRGFQCGYCTSGMIMVAIDLLRRNPNPTEAEIRLAISGNLCRCTGYDDIVKAIAGAAAQVQCNSSSKRKE